MLKELLQQNKQPDAKLQQSETIPQPKTEAVNNVLDTILKELVEITSIVRGKAKQKKKAAARVEANNRKAKRDAKAIEPKPLTMREKLAAKRKQTDEKRGYKKPTQKDGAAVKKPPVATTKKKKPAGGGRPVAQKPKQKQAPPPTQPTQQPQQKEDEGSGFGAILAGIGALFAGGGLISIFGDIIEGVLAGIGVDTTMFTEIKNFFKPILKGAKWVYDKVLKPAAAVVFELFKTSMRGWKLIIDGIKNTIKESFVLRKLFGISDEKEEDLKKETKQEVKKAAAKPKAKRDYAKEVPDAEKIRVEEKPQPTPVPTPTPAPKPAPVAVAAAPAPTPTPTVAVVPPPAPKPTPAAPAPAPVAAAPTPAPTPAPVPAAPPPAPTDAVSQIVSELNNAGITSKKAQGNILAQVAKESNFKPINEQLDKWSPQTLFRLYGPPGAEYVDSKGKSAVVPGHKNKVRFPTWENAVDLVKKGAEAIGDVVYGGRMGNMSPGDGFKYRGRGYIQLTGKEAYNRLGKVLGANLVSDPDKVNEPSIAAKIVPAFFLQYKGKRPEDLESIDSVNKLVGAADPKSQEQRVMLASRFEQQLTTGENLNQTSAVVNSEKARPRGGTQVALNVVDNSTNATVSKTIHPEKSRSSSTRALA